MLARPGPASNPEGRGRSPSGKVIEMDEATEDDKITNLWRLSLHYAWRHRAKLCETAMSPTHRDRDTARATVLRLIADYEACSMSPPVQQDGQDEWARWTRYRSEKARVAAMDPKTAKIILIETVGALYCALKNPLDVLEGLHPADVISKHIQRGNLLVDGVSDDGPLRCPPSTDPEALFRFRGGTVVITDLPVEEIEAGLYGRYETVNSIAHLSSSDAEVVLLGGYPVDEGTVAYAKIHATNHQSVVVICTDRDLGIDLAGRDDVMVVSSASDMLTTEEGDWEVSGVVSQLSDRVHTLWQAKERRISRAPEGRITRWYYQISTRFTEDHTGHCDPWIDEAVVHDDHDGGDLTISSEHRMTDDELIEWAQARESETMREAVRSYPLRIVRIEDE